MDNLCNSKVEAVARIEMITGKHVRFYRTDMRDEEDMRQIFEDNKIDAVIHFAGLKAVGESVEKPLEYYENNISGTLSLLRVMREYHCNVIIFSSSATVYGCNNEAPYVEEMPTSATNPYGYTKVMIEQILRDVCTANPEFTAVALRYFNPIVLTSAVCWARIPTESPTIWCPMWHRWHWASWIMCGYSVMTTTRRTALVCGTISMLWIWQPVTWQPWHTDWSTVALNRSI